MNVKLILLLPIFEIMTFVLFGDLLGFFQVIFLIFFTGIIGLYLLKSDLNIKNISEINANPNKWLFKKIAGLCLIIPGFITDIIGISLLFNSLRKYLWGYIPSNLKQNFDKSKNQKNEIIDVDYRDLDEK